MLWLALATSSLAQAPADASNLSCLTRLPQPAYPRIAWLAGVEGEVRVQIRISRVATISSIRADTASNLKPLLGDPLILDLEQSAVLPKCAGRLINALFRFELRGDPATEPASEAVLIPPSTIVVTAHPSAARN